MSASGLTSLLPTRSNSSQSDPSAEALNCLRVLGRILPVLYESEGGGLEGSNFAEQEGRRFVEELLWKREERLEDDSNDGGEDDEGQFVIDDDDDEAEDGLGKAEQDSSAATKPRRKMVALPSLADRLFHCAVDLMFTAGFTLPPGVGGEEGDKINYCIWEHGVGSTVDIGSTAQLDENKIEVLRELSSIFATGPKRTCANCICFCLARLLPDPHVDPDLHATSPPPVARVPAAPAAHPQDRASARALAPLLIPQHGPQPVSSPSSWCAAVLASARPRRKRHRRFRGWVRRRTRGSRGIEKESSSRTAGRAGLLVRGGDWSIDVP